MSCQTLLQVAYTLASSSVLYHSLNAIHTYNIKADYLCLWSAQCTTTLHQLWHILL